MSVYFIATQDHKFVKIGFTDQSVEDRLVSLLCAHPTNDALEILLVVPGTKKFEKHLHQKFSYLNTCREWFRLTDSMKHFIESIRLPGGLFAEVGNRFKTCLICGIHNRHAIMCPINPLADGVTR